MMMAKRQGRTGKKARRRTKDDGKKAMTGPTAKNDGRKYEKASLIIRMAGHHQRIIRQQIVLLTGIQLWDHAQPFLILSRNFFYFMKPGLL
jgi:hypothetical protein